MTWSLLTVAGLGVAVFGFYFVKVLRFAERNPAVALLEGAELVQWHQHELAAKGVTVPLSPPIVDPAKPPPALPDGTDEGA